MAARVQECVECAVLRPRREDGDAEVVHREIAARLWKVAGQANQLGVIAEELLTFLVGDLGTDVRGRRHSHLHACVDVLALVELLHQLLENGHLRRMLHGFPSDDGT